MFIFRYTNIHACTYYYLGLLYCLDSSKDSVTWITINMLLFLRIIYCLGLSLMKMLHEWVHVYKLLLFIYIFLITGLVEELKLTGCERKFKHNESEKYNSNITYCLIPGLRKKVNHL